MIQKWNDGASEEGREWRRKNTLSEGSPIPDPWVYQVTLQKDQKPLVIRLGKKDNWWVGLLNMENAAAGLRNNHNTKLNGSATLDRLPFFSFFLYFFPPFFLFHSAVFYFIVDPWCPPPCPWFFFHPQMSSVVSPFAQAQLDTPFLMRPPMQGVFLSPVSHIFVGLALHYPGAPPGSVMQ